MLHTTIERKKVKYESIRFDINKLNERTIDFFRKIPRKETRSIIIKRKKEKSYVNILFSSSFECN